MRGAGVAIQAAAARWARSRRETRPSSKKLGMVSTRCRHSILGNTWSCRESCRSWLPVAFHISKSAATTRPPFTGLSLQSTISLQQSVFLNLRWRWIAPCPGRTSAPRRFHSSVHYCFSFNKHPLIASTLLHHEDTTIIYTNHTPPIIHYTPRLFGYPHSSALSFIHYYRTCIIFDAILISPTRGYILLRTLHPLPVRQNGPPPTPIPPIRHPTPSTTHTHTRAHSTGTTKLSHAIPASDRIQLYSNP
ncbi:hypothetical protein BDZ94DRAFT_1269375 [Collybia nuda]|uniref:Uncharacterized protein n=1 Tax=Collybia nuda TaxID=64659 RepID=A0A9P5XXS9_9AGAR|nr:hypothetical protein BDZ94DRAFT_1269375 [Collybia nuda]